MEIDPNAAADPTQARSRALVYSKRERDCVLELDQPRYDYGMEIGLKPVQEPPYLKL